MKSRIVNGFSKLRKEEKLDKLVNLFDDSEVAKQEFKSFWHDDAKKQQLPLAELFKD